MADKAYEFGRVRVFECAAEGKQLKTDRDALDVVAAGIGQRASWIVIPVCRLADGFFQLSTRIAGEMIQKLVTYRLRVAFIGDISHYLDMSSAFRDFVRESNRGDQVWFLANLEELNERLQNIQANIGH
jgi:hypothetical protein